ncbi:molybdopterin cofactor-binding domain-containing protein, partial [Burkholderia pseudomallei]
HLVAHAQALAAHDEHVDGPRIGGRIGGKDSHSLLLACCAALAACKLQRPATLRPERDPDKMNPGKRHQFHDRNDVGHD